MFNEMSAEARPKPAVKSELHYWFVDGLVNSLHPRLEEIIHSEELVESRSTMKLIQYAFKDYEIALTDLSQGQLQAVAVVMPMILKDLQRLDYPLLQPELFECVKSFASKVGRAAEEHGLEFRAEIGQTLKG